jgi:hypothetical protein
MVVRNMVGCDSGGQVLNVREEYGGGRRPRAVIEAEHFSDVCEKYDRL